MVIRNGLALNSIGVQYPIRLLRRSRLSRNGSSPARHNGQSGRKTQGFPSTPRERSFLLVAKL
jgi:hypothetical protein